MYIDDEIINKVIKPFVIKKEYDNSCGDFYVSSAYIGAYELKSGDKITDVNNSKDGCEKISKELSDAGIGNRVGYNVEADLWSVAIL